MSQSIDSATKELLESIGKEEFSLRRSSRALRSPELDPIINGPLTPEPSPKDCLVSPQSAQLSQDTIMTQVSDAVQESQERVGSNVTAVSGESVAADIPGTPPRGLRRSKRIASTLATSAMRTISASALVPTELFEEEESTGLEPPSKKAKKSLLIKFRNSDRRLYIDNSDASAVQLPITPASAPGRASAGNELQGFTSTTNGLVAASISTTAGTGSPRKRAAPSKPKVQIVTDDQPLVDSRPEPHGQPLVWADQRQALCETLPYYRAYQSGAYTTDGLGYGFLLDKDCGERAYMDEEVVITRAGGGCKANDNGMMEQADDQCSTSLKITSFMKNKEQFVPVGLIVGAKNGICPSKIPHRYCVMDFFQVTEIWAEKSNRKTCFKFRFEKIDLDTKSWWAPAGSPLPARSDAKALRQACMHCKKSNPRVFQDGWMCLNDACNQFWRLNGQEAPTDLTYDPVFLQERHPWPSHIKPPYPLRPELLTADNRTDVNLAVSLASWKGMACPKCGRCNSRTLWHAWKCQTIGCGFEHGIQHNVIDPHSVLPDHGVEFTGHALPQDKYLEPITLREPAYIGDWRINTYDLLPGNHITHFMANGVINNKPGGAHDMFRALQGADLGLQRFPLAMSAMEGETLTKHFAVNYGMPYKYIVSVSSKGFSEAPQPVMDALNRLTWAGRYCVTDGSFKDFNEELVLGYFEKQAIGYHDDGEKDLGPTIATLSLGGDAVMFIRLKGRYYKFPKEFTLETYNPLAPVFLGSQLYKERLEVNGYYLAGDMEGFEMAKAELFRKLKKNNAKNAPPILTMKLKMGDIVVMHGAEMQKYFEHSIVPEGKLRFGLTCRYVDPSRIPENEHWKGKFQIDPANLYTGDVDTTTDDGDFSFSTNDDADSDAAVHAENTAADSAEDGDYVMIDSPTAASPGVIVSAVDMSPTRTMSDSENNPAVTPTSSASPAVSPKLDGLSRNAAVLNAPVWF